MLLHYVEEETCDVLDTLTLPELPQGSDEYIYTYKTAFKALADQFEPRKCVDYRKRKSQVKTLLSFTHVFNCWHASVNLLMRKWKLSSRLYKDYSSLRLRRKAIEQSLNFGNLLKVGHATETTDKQKTEQRIYL